MSAPTTIDCKGLKCPMPIVKLAQAIQASGPQDEFVVEATDAAFLPDIRAWADVTGHLLVSAEDGPVKRAVVRKQTGSGGAP